MVIDFHGRVAIVTGAGKGLGRSHAEALARRGAAVLVNNRTHPGEPSSADAVVEAIRAAGGRARANYDTVDSPGAGERIVAAAVEAFGRLDAVVANAGWSEPTAFHREAVDHFHKVIEVNTFGALDVIRAALPRLRAQNYGRIVVTTSSAAVFGDAGFVSYAAAKAALIGFVRALAQESTLAGVVVNALLPFAHTPMTDALFAGPAFPVHTAEVMTTGPATNLLLWLLSEQCSETGQTWLAGGRVFQKLLTQVTRGIVVPSADIGPEELAARVDEIGDPTSPASHASGAALLASMAQRSLSAGPTRDRRRLGTFANPGAAEYNEPGGPWFEQTMCRLLQEAPERNDLVCGDTVRLSTDGLRAAVGRAAGWLREAGVAPGDAVAWQLPNSPDAVVLYLATWWVGAVAVPFHDSLTSVEAQRVIDGVAGVAALIVDPALPLAAHAGATILPAAGIAALAAESRPVAQPACQPADAAVVLTTSGSSGVPKSVIHSHRSLAAKARQLSLLHGTTTDDAVLVPAPLSHMAGLLHAVMHPLGAGAKAVIMPRWDAADGLRLIRDEQVTMMFGPPIFTLGVAATYDFTPDAVKSIRLVSSGATAITEAYVRDVSEKFGAVVKRTYGSTEAPITCTAYPGDDPVRFWSTDGRPAPGVQLQIRSADGRVLPAGASGEIWLRGPELCDGYLDPEVTESTFVDGWMRTGDLGTLDEHGFLTVGGRISGLIIRGGMNISGREVEAALEKHPAISQAVVLGYPDELYGERVAAFVVCREPFDRPRCVQWFAKHGVAKYKVPDRIEVVDAIPVLSSYQKPDLGALRARLRD
ncbi:SDR family NAD(P)-dependent oxidoreductase [Mycolicibacterium moriokaense]|uniref:Acyl-CoA synthetase (AMP-forming)/AMP-acid ligase II n=1 Tax=Mycolicibacterium moriokaense TaxID=39691 RepID=A0A318HG09_9MYCO|nr:SDR family NAD(P)-dependent oxidoreductase [Mycolicibacterium moriokaense]PXX01648.1 acyl-CoA synthetase (AMP-forming)/AMP-acid ligase II [Mycolicibacterium moriokaense]